MKIRSDIKGVFIKGKERKPGANTILYLPLNGDYIDYSNKHRTVSVYGSMSYDASTKSAIFNNTNYLYINSFGSLAHDWTMSVWVKRTKTSSGNATHIGSMGTGSSRKCLFLGLYNGSSSSQPIGTLQLAQYGEDFVSDSTKLTQLNERYNLVYTYEYNSRKAKAYINGVKVIENTFGGQYSLGATTWYIGVAGMDTGTTYRFSGNMSRYIMENVVWNEDDVNLDFNLTKEQYGYTRTKRAPGTNTVLYLPMNEDILDHGPNNISITNNNSVSVVADESTGLKVGNFSGATRNLSFTNPTNMSGAWTINVRARSTATAQQWFLAQGTESTNRLLHVGFSDTSRGLVFGSYANDIDTNNRSWLDGKRHMFTFTYNGAGAKKIYVDGFLVKEGSQSGLNTGNNTGYIGRYATGTVYEFAGAMSQYIMENKTWTQQSISSYYFNTKSAYQGGSTGLTNIKAVYIKNPAKPRLPSGYTEVEYIQSTGGQYINLTYKPKNTTRMQFKYVYTNYNGNVFIGSKGNSDSDDWRFFRASSTTYFDMGSGRINGSYVTSTTDEYETEIGNYYVKNLKTGANVLTGTAQGSYTKSYSIRIFTQNSDYGKIYYLKIYEGNSLVQDFVPCYRKSDNVIGLYDLVENKFYTNSGSGTFSKGADVAVPDLIQIRPSEEEKKETTYVMLGDGVNRFSELTKSQNNTLMSVSDGGTYWNIFTSQTDRATTGYKVFDKEIIGFDIEWQKTEDYSYSGLQFFMQADKGTNDVDANSIHVQNDRDNWSGRYGICVWNNGTAIKYSGSYTTSVVNTVGRKNGDTWTISSTGGITDTVTVTTTDKYYRMSVGGWRWYTGTMGRINKLIIYLGQ